MSLSEHMYGPHVLVRVRVRGAFQKKTKNKNLGGYLHQNELREFYARSVLT